MVAVNTILCYPNLNKPFQIYKDASEYQMGAATVQKGHPVAY